MVRSSMIIAGRANNSMTDLKNSEGQVRVYGHDITVVRMVFIEQEERYILGKEMRVSGLRIGT